LKNYRILIRPEDKVIRGYEGETIKEVLDREGICFPNNCGGEGKCLSCRIEFLADTPQMTDGEKSLLDPESRCRMSCQHKLNQDIEILIPGFSIRDDEKKLYDFKIDSGGEGFGIAVDLGTTLIALYLINLQNGEIISQHSVLNPQIQFGGDVMSRLEAAKTDLHRKKMTRLIHRRVTEVIQHALDRNSIDSEEVKRLFMAGNSVMSHFWLGFGGEGLERVPFRSVLEDKGIIPFDPALTGLKKECRAEVCPILSGFIGGDITAAILASNLDSFTSSFSPRLLIDFGTNGEIVLSVNSSLFAVSTAAGPAFEGIGMHSGMPAQPGAIEGFTEDGNPIVIDGGKPFGFCGSGYISAFELLLRKRILSSSGLLERDQYGDRKWSPDSNPDQPPYIVQDDVRKFQLAKGAVAAGVEILCREAEINPDDLGEIILTGSFGNRIDPKTAINTGLIPDVSPEKVTYIDNAAGRGAALCLGNDSCRKRVERLQRLVKVINLGENPSFEERFIANMHFPVEYPRKHRAGS